MRQLIILFFCGLFCMKIDAQEQIIRTDTLSIPLKLTSESKQLVLVSNPADVKNNSLFTSLLKVQSVQLADADLIIQFESPIFKLGHYYTTRFELVPNSSDTFDLRRDLQYTELVGVNGLLTKNYEAPYQTTWKDVLDQKLDFEKDYQLQLIYDLHGKLNEAPKIDWSLKNNSNKIQYAGLLLSAVCIGVAKSQANAADNSYDDYQRAWQQTNSSVLSSDDLLLANRKTKSHNTLMKVGIGALLVNTAFLGVRVGIFAQKKQAYKLFFETKS